MKNFNRFIIALLCAAVCAGAVSCDDNDKKTTRKATSVTVQGNEPTQSTTKGDYDPVSVDGMDVLYSGWIKLPTGKEYIILLNALDQKYVNGYAYPDFPADVYKEEGEYLLVKTLDKVGYIPKTNFTTEAPEIEGHVENTTK
ncbi:MAG: hypothetical protein K6G82_08295 [Ruminococcus sp.]|nr:hypothetical protein [Ruminococcus sp.]